VAANGIFGSAAPADVNPASGVELTPHHG